MDVVGWDESVKEKICVCQCLHFALMTSDLDALIKINGSVQPVPLWYRCLRLAITESVDTAVDGVFRCINVL